SSYQRSFDVQQTLANVVRGITDQTSETAFLSTLDGKSVILKYLSEGSHPLRVSGLYVGLTGNEHRRASGKAVLAHLDTGARNRLLERSLQGIPEPERA